MFREMRKKERQMNEEDAIKVFAEGSNGVLSVQGENGYPYGAPMSYVYDDGKIYFHCATEGHKIDAIKKDPKVSFCVTEKDEVNGRLFTTDYRSAVAFGKVRIVDDEEKKEFMMKVADKYSKGYGVGAEKYIRAVFDRLMVIEMTIEHMTGKKNKK